MELGTIRQINIDTEMQASYLDYAMSVIVARALPDVRDGLKPVHRRILYAMHDLGLSHDKPYKKSARIVGEVLGKYHPHGDAAVYEAMVRMAQDFSLRCTLVDGQGNFGSVDGDNAAAMRYTEARLAAISAEMLTDIEKDTVDWSDNFDGTLKEPTVLPAALPNLLINGSSGIAVGMSTNIPPHNLGEVCDALVYLIDNHDRAEDVMVEDLIQFIPGPDFPTGGLVYRYRHEGSGANQEEVDVITKAYASGRGRIVMQAKAHIEEMSRNRNRIVVTELPYQANKTNLLERIADLVRDGRLDGITDLRDESDRTGMRICIELTRTVDPRDVLADLFKLTPLQSTFGVSLLALVDGEPRLLSLKRVLMHYLEHRQEVIVRRSKYELAKARQRAHILEGLLRALDVLDEVIALIRKSKTADTARRNLISEFKFTEIQAQAILDMQLRRLAALERRKLQDEYREIIALIRALEALLASPKKVLALIRQNLLDLKARYADPRRTQIADRVKGTLTAQDILPDQDVWITLSADGVLARQPLEAPNVSRLSKLARDASAALLAANTRQALFLFSAKGQAARVPIHQIPEGAGAHFADVSGLTRRDRVVAARAIPRPEGEEPAPDSGQDYLLLGTVQGKVKRVTIADLLAQAHTDPQVIGLDDGDELLWVDRSAGGGEMLLVTASGQAIRFAEEDVRSMGLAAGGIGGIKLGDKDRVVAGGAIPAAPRADFSVVMITATGYGKQVALADFPAQGRYGQGVVVAKLSDRTGEIVGAALAGRDDYLMCFNARGAATVLTLASVPVMGRPAQGKPVVPVAKGDPVQWAYVVGATGEPQAPTPVAGSEPEQPARLARTRRTKAPAAEEAVAVAPKSSHTRRLKAQVTAEAPEAAPKPSRARRTKAPATAEAPEAAPEPSRTRRTKAPATAEAPEAASKPARTRRTPTPTSAETPAKAPPRPRAKKTEAPASQTAGSARRKRANQQKE